MSTNLSRQKREALLGKIDEIRSFIASAPQNAETGELLAHLSDLEKEVSGKKYGLVFEEHREEIDEILDTHAPVLSEAEELFVGSGGGMNFLIEGDNLASLRLLEKTHRGKIDLIYIDPPYNTGNRDFMYDDNYVESGDLFRHSKWSSFMIKRLRLAKALLSEQGVIFISINDFELATLRLLCDEVFGESNFIGHLTWESTTQPTNAGKARFQLQKKVESILCFAKRKSSREDFILKKINGSLKYPHRGAFGACRFEIIEKSDAGTYQRNTMKFPILGQMPRAGKRWQIGLETARALEAAGRLELVDGIVKRAVYPEDEVDKLKLEPFWSHLTAERVGTAQLGKEQLNSILERPVGFDTVKPVGLIAELLSHFPKSITVLDFFAGSGTTGHAVMKLNAEDGGSRKFILCTNNENGICRDITYERLRRVIEKENYRASLKYYRVGFIPTGNRMFYEYADELMPHMRELIELENGVNLRQGDEIVTALSDDELDELTESSEKLAHCRAIYIGNDVLPDEEQELLLKKHGIRLNIIPDYYYHDLQED